MQDTAEHKQVQEQPPTATPPAATAEPARTTRALRMHTAGCYWDVLDCCWRCGPDCR